MNKTRPIIGIVAKFNDFDDPNFLWRRQVFDGLTRSILIKHGANVLGILPQNQAVDFNDNDAGIHLITMTKEEEKNFTTMLNLCDGIVLQGGANSDYYEEFAAKYCYDNNIPLLGICAGYNNIVRSLGGTTTTNDDSHNKFGEKLVHDIEIVSGTLLHKIVNCNNIKVNSIHSWVADKLNNLVANCYSPDGCIEGVEAPNKKFIMGLKFHPELLADNPNIDAIFKQFVESCKK